jgi:yeast amino acid transporter
VAAVFAYLGTELVGVTVGEAQNPRKTIPRAIKLTFYRILFFYVLSVFFLGMIVPYDSERLAFAIKKGGTTAAASPFVVAIQIAGIPHLPGIVNGCICLFVFSAANSDLYIASRTLYGLASEGYAPRIFKRTDRRGVPIYALGLSAIIAFIAFLNVADDSRKVFIYFFNLVTIFGLLTWISILVAHIWFVRARKAQGIPDSALAFKAPLGIWGSYCALAFCILIALTKNFSAFVPKVNPGKKFNTSDFVTGYLGIPLYLIMLFGYKFWLKTRQVRPETADFYTGKDLIDREEEEFLANKAQKERLSGRNGSWFYRTFVAWLF